MENVVRSETGSAGHVLTRRSGGYVFEALPAAQSVVTGATLRLNGLGLELELMRSSGGVLDSNTLTLPIPIAATPTEVTAGTETALRLFSPAQVAQSAQIHGGGGGGGGTTVIANPGGTGLPTLSTITIGATAYTVGAGGGGGGASLSNNAPSDVFDTPVFGVGLSASRYDHVHRLPIDNTLDWDASAQIGVNVHDVIEHLQERIQYKTNSTHYDSGGASVGQVYDTSAFRKTISKITALFEPLSGADAYVARLYEVASDNNIISKIADSNTLHGPFGLGATPRTFKFTTASGEAGVPISGGIRLAILVSRTGDDSDSDAAAVHGSLEPGTPAESYSDASDDFDLVNGVVYRHIEPMTGHSTHSHTTGVYAEIKIFYTLTYDHGSFVGDGNVNAAHIDSESADDGQVLTADGAGGATWEDGGRRGRHGRYHGRHDERHVRARGRRCQWGRGPAARYQPAQRTDHHRGRRPSGVR